MRGFKKYYRKKIITLQLHNYFYSTFRNPNSAMGHLLVTKTSKPIWESFSAMAKAASLVSNWPTLTR